MIEFTRDGTYRAVTTNGYRERRSKIRVVAVAPHASTIDNKQPFRFDDGERH
jgi:hypothetical protein